MIALRQEIRYNREEIQFISMVKDGAHNDLLYS